MIEAYKVTQTATKFAIDRHGVIIHQRGYGVGSAADWDEWLQGLAAS